MASVWKLILKTLQLHQELCTELELENAIAIAFLVDEIISRHFDGIVLKGHLEPRHAKIVGFMLKVIVGLAEKVNALESPLANTAVLRLVVYLQRFLPIQPNGRFVRGNFFFLILQAHSGRSEFRAWLQ